MVETEQLMGIYEIAEMAGVTRAAVANWRTRFRDFPTPVRELRSGPVFGRGQHNSVPDRERSWVREKTGPSVQTRVRSMWQWRQMPIPHFM